MSALIDRYWEQYGSKKKSEDRKKSILEGIREKLGSCLYGRWTVPPLIGGIRTSPRLKGLSQGTAVRHFNVMHHMMEKAATIWSKETGIDRNPADAVEVKTAGRPKGTIPRRGGDRAG